MTNCQLSISCPTLLHQKTGGFLHLAVSADPAVIYPGTRRERSGCVNYHHSLCFTLFAWQAGARAQLEGVTYTGHTDLGAALDAPATGLLLAHEAIIITDSQISARGTVHHSKA
jgi:hypothetical protein